MTEHTQFPPLMASTGSTSGITSETRDRNGLCLLSLDGGGVRGLSTLLILKGIMQQINSKLESEGSSHVKPCDVFDLIGGTSTGGLLAIMLGRLEMDIEPCIEAYSEFSRRVFSRKNLPVDVRGRYKGRYKAAELEGATKDIVKASGLPVDEPLNDRKDRGCRAFVCAVRKENKAVARLRAYKSDRALVEDRALIWEAARATSAASSFFDPISIGEHGQEYVDAGLGCNNPVQEVWTEAQDIWSPGEDDLATVVKCFISIGTGDPGTSPIEDGTIKIFTKTLKEIVTETEETAETFVQSHRGLFSQERYFRFNVDQGLQSVGLEEYKKENEIVSATTRYMESQRMVSQVQSCSRAMKDKEFWKGDCTEMILLILREFQCAHEQFQLPFSLAAAPEIHYFVGRVSDLSSIESALLPITAERKFTVLHGLGGIGKSQLAIEYAKKHRYDYTAVFWLNAKTEDTLKRSLAAGATRLPKKYFNQDLLYGSQNQEALSVILHEMKAWFDLPGNHRWLLIFDNVDNPKIPDNKDSDAYDIRSYFPETHQGSILVTTRWKTLSIGHLLEVVKLSTADDSVSLLEQISGRAIGEDPDIEDLLEKLDGLPLALATAGGYLGLTGISVSEYLHDYEASWLELQKTSPVLLSYDDKTIYSTWDLSYNHIREEDELAAKLLEFWAYFDNQDLWYDLLKDGKKDWAPDWFHHIVGTGLVFRTAVMKLQKHALVERLTDSGGFSMHHCVHAWVKNVLSKTIEFHNMRLALACVGDTVPIENARGDWMIKQRLFPHIERLLELLSDWDQEGRNTETKEMCIVQFSYSVGNLYLNQGMPTKAESMVLRAFNSSEKIFGPDDKITLRSLRSVADLYEQKGRWPKAESMYMRHLTGFEKQPGLDDESTLNTVNRLGSLYTRQGKLKEAEPMYQRALTGYQKIFGPDHESTLDVVNNLGILHVRQGKLKEAEPMYERALTGYQEIFGPDHESTLGVVNNLGVIYDRQGKLKEAELMYQRALTGYQEILRPDHKSTLLTVNNLGVLYERQGRLEEAESLFQRALTSKEKILGPDHKSTLDTVHNLGVLCAQQGRLKEAELMYQRALSGYTRNPPEGPRGQLRLFYDIGLLYQDIQKFEKAKDFFSQAYEGRRELSGSQHDDTIRALVQVNIEIERKRQPDAFVSDEMSMSVPEETLEAEIWAQTEKSVAQIVRRSTEENNSRASQNDTEDGQKSAEETIESQVARISAKIRATTAKRTRMRQAESSQPRE